MRALCAPCAWRFTNREIVEAVRWEMLSAYGRHPVTHRGCGAILERLGAL